ncbi:LSMD1 domain-containing protein Sbat isoform X1 [Dermacentor variabilis]|uniref:LSMD1 domain-containing protein Sbat isoform X1 n=1 Tax=Dermacentor variabilis TaxID=34621 RepID=UPI003F5AEE7D
MAAGEERRARLRQWLNQSLRVEMSDGRTLVGSFLCTDRDQNIILGSCSEYLQPGGPADHSVPLGLCFCEGSFAAVHGAPRCLGEGCWQASHKDSSGSTVEPRILGLAMVPGQHIISVHVDEQCSG